MIHIIHFSNMLQKIDLIYFSLHYSHSEDVRPDGNIHEQNCYQCKSVLTLSFLDAIQLSSGQHTHTQHLYVDSTLTSCCCVSLSRPPPLGSVPFPFPPEFATSVLIILEITATLNLIPLPDPVAAERLMVGAVKIF